LEGAAQPLSLVLLPDGSPLQFTVAMRSSSPGVFVRVTECAVAVTHAIGVFLIVVGIGAVRDALVDGSLPLEGMAGSALRFFGFGLPLVDPPTRRSLFLPRMHAVSSRPRIVWNYRFVSEVPLWCWGLWCFFFCSEIPGVSSIRSTIGCSTECCRRRYRYCLSSCAVRASMIVSWWSCCDCHCHCHCRFVFQL